MRQRIVNFKDQMTEAINSCGAADEAFLVKAQLEVNDVLADPSQGTGISLYEAMSHTPKSERKAGLTRKGGVAPQPKA